MKQALLIKSQGDLSPNGREQIWRVRGGVLGKGKQYGPSIKVWPWSEISKDEAYKIIDEICYKNDLLIRFQ